MFALFAHTCPRVEIQGGPQILSFNAFLCDNFKFFPNFDLSEGGGYRVGTPKAQGGHHPLSPPVDTYVFA